MSRPGPSAPRRTGPSRDRRGRGARGPAVLPGPLSPRGVPAVLTRRERFDRLVLEVVDRLEERWPKELAHVEFAVEDTPVLPDDWAGHSVPLASVQPAPAGGAPRVVVFRRPIELRCETGADLPPLLGSVVVEQVAELLGRSPEEIDPGYDADR